MLKFVESGADYETLTQTLTFLAGSTSASISVTSLGDVTQEGSESFTATLTNPTNGLSVGPRDRATVDIIDDDGKIILSGDI